MKLISKSLLVVSSFLVLASCGGGGGTVVTSSETSSSETPITTSEQPVVTSEERPVVTSEAPVTTSEEKPVVTSEEQPVVTSEQKPVVTSEEAPVTTSEEKPVVTSEEQPVVTSEEKPVVTSEIPAESETPIESSEEEKEYYTITFETNGGSYVAPIQVEFNTLAAKPADPVKDGCEFLGWFKDTYCITPFDWAKHLVTADWILYAGWEGDEPVESSEELPPVESSEEIIETSEAAEFEYAIVIDGVEHGAIANPEAENEFMVLGVEVAVGAKVEFKNYSTGSTWTPILDEASKGFEQRPEGIFCIEANKYDFYFKMIFGGDQLYVGYAGGEPVESSEELPVESSEEAGELILTLDPGVWDSTGSPRYAVYLFKDTSNEWMDMQKNGSVYVVTLSQTQLASYNKVIFTRMNPASSENTWSNRWNQSNDLDIPSVSSTYTITGWGDKGQNSPGQWSN